MKFLSVVVKVKDGAEFALRALLEEIQQDLDGNPYMRFPASANTHFARFVILHDVEHGHRLLFATNYDGNLSSYLTELAEISPNLDGLWGSCEGYTSAATFARFIRKNSYKSRGTYVGFPDETVATIKNKMAIRKHLEAILDSPGLSRTVNSQNLADLLTRLSQLPQSRSAVSSAAHSIATLKTRVFKWFHATFFRYYLAFAFWYNEYGMPSDFERVTSRCDAGPPDFRTAPSAPGQQTSFTVFAEIKPERLTRLRIALIGSLALTRFAFRAGEFANVYSLHAFRWILLDGGKRLVFMSTFDGTWENYMGDFIDNLVWALDGLYSNTYGYPAAGMKEVVKFKQWIRDHQPMPSVVYNAYPEETVLNLLRDREAANILGANFDRESVQQLLQVL